MAGVISVPIQIRFADIDLAQHAHNAVYLHWFEQARMALIAHFVPIDHNWHERGLIIARNEIDYRAPVLLHDQITVETWCSAIGNKSFDLRYEVVRHGDRRTICAEGRSVMVCYDLKAGRSLMLPADWRSALEKLKRE